MELSKAEATALKLIDKYIPNWKFEWHTRQRVFGTCRHATKTILLSSKLTPVRTDEEVINTILHEIAHAIAGPGVGHGFEWKNIAASIGVKNPTATSRMKVSELEDLKTIGAKWVMVVASDNYVVKHWFRKPAKTTFAKLPHLYLNSRPDEKLEIISIADYEARI